MVRTHVLAPVGASPFGTSAQDWKVGKDAGIDRGLPDSAQSFLRFHLVAVVRLISRLARYSDHGLNLWHLS